MAHVLLVGGTTSDIWSLESQSGTTAVIGSTGGDLYLIVDNAIGFTINGNEKQQLATPASGRRHQGQHWILESSMAEYHFFFVR